MPVEIAKLLNPDQKEFEKALVSLRGLRRQSGATFDDFINILKAFDKDEFLSESERCRRVQMIFQSWDPDASEQVKTAKQAASMNHSTRIALLGCFSPNIRRKVYEPAGDRTLPQTGTSDSEKPIKSAEASLNDNASIDSAVGKTGEDSAAKDEAEEGQQSAVDHRIVLLLGVADRHEANMSFLKAHNFSPVRASTLEMRDGLLNSSVCGVVVDGSWWSLFPGDKQIEELRKILAHSTFAFLKIDQTGLDENAASKIPKLSTEVRFREPLSSEFNAGIDSRIALTDLGYFKKAASNLHASQHCRFHPAEIAAEEGMVLLAAIKKQVNIRHPFRGYEIQRVDTSIMLGGQTRARVIVLKPDDGGIPFVAKIDNIAALTEEMNRFNRFIKPWDDNLNPELHVHGSVGVILFGLVERAIRDGSPAPTLHDLMRQLCAVERGATIKDLPTAEDISTALKRAIKRLADLNSRQCKAEDVKNACWLGIEPLYEMRKKGILYSISGKSGEIDLMQQCEKAQMRIDMLDGKATVHGDAHCRNVLVREKDPFLIDYAYSGPGHPCFDVVRLVSSLLFSDFRMTDDEDRLERCFEATLVEGKSFDELSTDFPDICASDGSRISIEAAVSGRAAALELAKQYGGDERDYFAVEFVVACQSLTMPDFQSGVIRAAIKALAPMI